MARRIIRRPRPGLRVVLYRKLPGGASGTDAPAVPAGAVAWYRASDLAAGPVAAWPDASGSGHPLAVPGFATAPSFVAASAAGGKPAARFAGTTNALQAVFALTQPATFLLVVARHNWSGGYLFDGGLGNGAGFLGFGNVGFYEMYSGAALTNYPGGTAAAAPFLLTAVFNGASSSFGFGSGAPAAAGDAGSFTPGGVTLGSYAGGGSFADCDLCELVVYPRVLSAADLTQARTYLMTRYGLA